MIQSFKDQASEDVFHGTRNKNALKKLPIHLWKIAFRKFYMLDHAVSLQDIKSPPSNQLESLKGNRKGQYSIRINDQYRICFQWTAFGPELAEIVDYH